MYKLVKEIISNDSSYKNYSNDGQRFVIWYLRTIYGLDSYVAKDCLVDGPHDKQIDAVYIDVDDEVVHIIQGKFSRNNIKQDAIREVQSAFENFRDFKKLQSSANLELQMTLNDIQEAINKNYSIIFELITTGNGTEGARKESDRLAEIISSNNTFDARFDFIDKNILQVKYNDSIGSEHKPITHIFTIEEDKYMEFIGNGIKTVITALSLKECIKLPGIKDGTLFSRNVRKSLGKNKVNKIIGDTLRKSPDDFFFFHNGITAICSSISRSTSDLTLTVKGINIVNGCQSLTEILRNSAAVKEDSCSGYILFKFYEIKATDKADGISRYTNMQTAVKPRDLKSNEHNLLKIKNEYEGKYPNAYLATKRGETIRTVPVKRDLDSDLFIDIERLAKILAAWYLHNPMLAATPADLFSDNTFNKLFCDNLRSEDIYALVKISSAIDKYWSSEKCQLNDEFRTIKAVGLYYHMHAIAMLFNHYNNQNDTTTPIPAMVLQKLKDDRDMEWIIERSSIIMNNTLKHTAPRNSDKAVPFNPKNWIKNQQSVKDLLEEIDREKSYLSAEIIQRYDTVLCLSKSAFIAS